MDFKFANQLNQTIEDEELIRLIDEMVEEYKQDIDECEKELEEIGTAALMGILSAMALIALFVIFLGF